jgi:hypothetical protein
MISIDSITTIPGIGFLNGLLTLIAFLLLTRIALNRRVAAVESRGNKGIQNRTK